MRLFLPEVSRDLPMRRCLALAAVALAELPGAWQGVLWIAGAAFVCATWAAVVTAFAWAMIDCGRRA